MLNRVTRPVIMYHGHTMDMPCLHMTTAQQGHVDRPTLPPYHQITHVAITREWNNVLGNVIRTGPAGSTGSTVNLAHLRSGRKPKTGSQ
ncbi:hypothetical protein A2U01_0056030 [Trifolium medium]|uniref:Uncharacterized protein n=1 Tax=Trifolium medium TaxID=97028 RepID=A0A392REZ4_9FABA|nr:hypothetical protein [Trifolium medium]